MPIVKKKNEPQLPPILQDEARSALYLQVASQFYEEKFKEVKQAFFGTIANSADLTLEVGKSLRFADGLVRWQARSNFAVDKEAIAQAVKDGRITTEALVACVSKFDHKAVAALIPQAVSETDPTEFGVMQANADFKKRVLDRLEEDERERAEIFGALNASVRA